MDFGVILGFLGHPEIFWILGYFGCGNQNVIKFLTSVKFYAGFEFFTYFAHTDARAKNCASTHLQFFKIDRANSTAPKFKNKQELLIMGGSKYNLFSIIIICRSM